MKDIQMNDKVGLPTRIDSYNLEDERGFEFYDANGMLAGTVALFSDGTMYAVFNHEGLCMRITNSINERYSNG
jgi:hypothetical protein